MNWKTQTISLPHWVQRNKIKILQGKNKDLEQQVEDLKESKFDVAKISKNSELPTFYTGFISKTDSITFEAGVNHMPKLR